MHKPVRLYYIGLDSAAESFARIDDRESFSDIWAGLDHVMDSLLLPAKCSGCTKRILCPVCIAVTQSESAVPVLWLLHNGNAGGKATGGAAALPKWALLGTQYTRHIDGVGRL